VDAPEQVEGLGGLGVGQRTQPCPSVNCPAAVAISVGGGEIYDLPGQERHPARQFGRGAEHLG
jgi:hypothetical protein